MAKINLSEEDLKLLSECINEQKDVPAELLTKLSPGFFEKIAADGRFDFKALDKFKIPTIEYAGKRPESIILAQAAITGGAAPLQVVRSFANGKNGDWKNLIVQGDNLQFLKTCYMNQDPLIKDKVKGKVKLICIDPPFATKSDFGSKDGERSYSDKVDTAEFIEALRERLIYQRELLDDDGSIYLHLDNKMSHYAKVMMDEVFGKDNFRNEIFASRIKKNVNEYEQANSLNVDLDNILFYSKTQNAKIYLPRIESNKEPRWHSFEASEVRSGMDYDLFGFKPKTGNHWRWSYERAQQSIEDGLLRANPRTGKPEYLVTKDFEIVGTNWSKLTAYSFKYNYPTEKAEALLERIILASSNPGDLVMDIFGGSGTTVAVAEKLDRRWITCDFGKHSIYTMQKRILNIADSKKLGNGEKAAKYVQPSKPFCVVSAGVYDFTRIMDLRKNQDAYITFVLGLFNIMREKADYSKKYKLPNIYAEKSGNPVEVFPVWDDEYLKNIRIDEEYLQGIIDASGGKLKGDYYIITPETCARLGDTTLKNVGKEKVNFKLLKFPYKVLEELSRHFQIEEQAASSADINRLISSVGFYFNDEVKVGAARKNGGIKLTKFNSGILDKSGRRFEGLTGLAMILVDLDYDGKVFDMDVAIYSKDMGEDGVVTVEGLTKDAHLIAIDKHGNESKVIPIK